jgi:hypothetical protein
MQRALQITERTYGPAHPSVAVCLSNLAGLLQVTNRLQEAEPLVRRALKIDEMSYACEPVSIRSTTQRFVERNKPFVG